MAGGRVSEILVSENAEADTEGPLEGILLRASDNEFLLCHYSPEDSHFAWNLPLTAPESDLLAVPTGSLLGNVSVWESVQPARKPIHSNSEEEKKRSKQTVLLILTVQFKN